MARSLAYDVLTRVDEHDAFSNRALDAELALRDLEDRDRRLGTEIVYGVLTWRKAIDRVLDEVVHGGIGSLDDEVLRTLRIGAYQLLFLDRVPAHAIVDEAVEMTRERANSGAVSLVNAVLREIDREAPYEWWEPSDREAKPVRYLGDRYAFPSWMANRLQQLFGIERGEAMAEALNARPPIFLRELDDAQDSPDVASVEGVPRALRAENMTSDIQDRLAGREWIIQDLGSQLVGLFVGASPGESVLDACAGLGSKTLTLAEGVGDEGRVFGVDAIKWKVDKLVRVAEDSSVGGRIEARASDLQDLSVESVGQFDRVLVDAPCSALGVIRRHPEIKWNRDESAIPSLVDLQAELLASAAEFVAPGGTLVYSVCTFTTEEGPKQVDSFLETHDAFVRSGPPEPSEIDWTRYLNGDGDLSLNPVDHDTDAFYAARLRRAESG